jgi:putative endonuclease
VAFHVYILECADASFYIGHTDDLNTRLGLHMAGTVPCYTSSRLLVRLAWEQEFATRQEAIEAEQRIKRWSHAKKQALVVGDWAELSRLAHLHGRQSHLGQPQRRSQICWAAWFDKLTTNGFDRPTRIQ